MRTTNWSRFCVIWFNRSAVRANIMTNVPDLLDNMKVGVLGSLGLGFRVFTVISLVQKVERSFNEIWRVE